MKIIEAELRTFLAYVQWLISQMNIFSTTFHMACIAELGINRCRLLLIDIKNQDNAISTWQSE